MSSNKQPTQEEVKYFGWDDTGALTTNEELALSGLTTKQLGQILKLYLKYGRSSIYSALFYGVERASTPSAEDLAIGRKFIKILRTPPSYFNSIDWGEQWIEDKAHGIAFRISKKVLLYVVRGTGKRKLIEQRKQEAYSLIGDPLPTDQTFTISGFGGSD